MNQWLIRLYPKSWRERYGEEFLALLEQESLTLRIVLDIIRGAFDAHWNHLIIHQPEHISFTFTLRFRRKWLRRMIIIFLCYSMSYVGFRSTDIMVHSAMNRYTPFSQHRVVATWAPGRENPLTLFYAPLRFVESSTWPVVDAATVYLNGPPPEVSQR